MKRIFLKAIALSLLVFMAGCFVACEKDSDIKQYVYPVPKVTSYYPVSGYVNSEVTILGEEFVNSVKDKDGNDIGPVKVYFGGIESDGILSCKDNCIVVKVPDGALSGEISLRVWTHEVTVGHYTVVPAPTVSSLVSDNEFGSTAAVAGDEVTISGTGFGTDMEKVSVDFNGTPAEIIFLSDTEIKVITPAGYKSGEVTVIVNGFRIVAGALLNPDSKGDVTMFYLKNYRNPQSADLTSAQAGTKTTIGLPEGWTYTPNMLNKKNEGGEEWVGLLIMEPAGNFFSVAAGWNDPIVEPTDEVTPNLNFIKNGKMYQKTTLPAGSYTLQVDVKARGNSNSQISFMVAKPGTGEDEFPDYDNVEDNDLVLESVTENLNTARSGSYTLSFDFVLSESTEVLIGMSLNFRWNIFYDFYGFRLILN